MDLHFQLILFEYIVSLKWSCNIQFWNNFCLEIIIYQHWHVHSDRLTGPLMLISLVHLAQQTSINYFYLVYPKSKFRCTCSCHGESDPLLPSQPMQRTVEVVTIIPWSTCTCMYVQHSNKLQESGILHNPPHTDQWNDMKQGLCFSITIWED